jgi:hypothetical protein
MPLDLLTRILTRYFHLSIIFALLLLSIFRLLAYSICEIATKNKPAGRRADYTVHLWAKCVAGAV